MPHLLPVSLFALSLSALEPQSVVGEIISFDRSQIASSQDAEALLDRIEAAAQQVCIEEQRYAAHLPRAQRICAEFAIETAVRDISSPELTDVFEQRLRHREKSRKN